MERDKLVKLLCGLSEVWEEGKGTLSSEQYVAFGIMFELLGNLIYREDKKE